MLEMNSLGQRVIGERRKPRRKSSIEGETASINLMLQHTNSTSGKITADRGRNTRLAKIYEWSVHKERLTKQRYRLQKGIKLDMCIYHDINHREKIKMC